MDLMTEFEKRRGVIPPPPAPPQQEPASSLDVALDTKHVLELAFAGRLQQSYLIPVMPYYRPVFGSSIWICPDEDKAQRKQKAENILAFAPHELMDIVSLAAQNIQKAARIMSAKKAFCGTVTR